MPTDNINYPPEIPSELPMSSKPVKQGPKTASISSGVKARRLQKCCIKQKRNFHDQATNKRINQPEKFTYLYHVNYSLKHFCG